MRMGRKVEMEEGGKEAGTRDGGEKERKEATRERGDEATGGFFPFLFSLLYFGMTTATWAGSLSAVCLPICPRETFHTTSIAYVMQKDKHLM